MTVSKGYLSTTLSAQGTGKPTHSRHVCVRLLLEVSMVGGIATSLNSYRVAMAVSKGYLSTTLSAKALANPQNLGQCASDCF